MIKASFPLIRKRSHIFMPDLTFLASLPFSLFFLSARQNKCAEILPIFGRVIVLQCGPLISNNRAIPSVHFSTKAKIRIQKLINQQQTRFGRKRNRNATFVFWFFFPHVFRLGFISTSASPSLPAEKKGERRERMQNCFSLLLHFWHFYFQLRAKPAAASARLLHALLLTVWLHWLTP